MSEILDLEEFLRNFTNTNISSIERGILEDMIRIYRYNLRMPLHEFSIFMVILGLISFTNSIFRAYLLLSSRNSENTKLQAHYLKSVWYLNLQVLIILKSIIFIF